MLLLLLLLFFINLQHSALVTTFSSVARSKAEHEQRPANISFDSQFWKSPKESGCLKTKKIPSYITQLYGCTSTKIATTSPTCGGNLVAWLSQNDVSSQVSHDAVASDHLVGRADDVHLWFGNVSYVDFRPGVHLSPLLSVFELIQS